jgi:hypothetical protein
MARENFEGGMMVVIYDKDGKEESVSWDGESDYYGLPKREKGLPLPRVADDDDVDYEE